jgi:hypothetical protein
VAEQSAYHHGEASLQAVSINGKLEKHRGNSD